MKTRKMPQRMCVGCRMMTDKKKLLRIVRNKEGVIAVDNTGKMPGRGAYLCGNIACLNKAVKAKLLDKALGHAVGQEIIDQLRVEFEKYG